MAKKITTETDVEKSTYSNSLFNLVDEKVEKRLHDVTKQADEAVFDNSHQTENLFKVYDEIDKNKLERSISDEPYDDFNPFYGNKDALKTLKEKHSYKEIVSVSDDAVPTLEIKEEIVDRPKPQEQTKRKKLWFVTGGVCIALFLSLFTYNMININTLAKKVVTTQNDITQQEQVLEQGVKDYQDRLTDLDLIATEGMVENDLSTATGVDLSAKNDGVIHEQNTNFWDKVCNFFAKMFGR